MKYWLAVITGSVLLLLVGAYVAFPTLAGWIGGALTSHWGATGLTLVVDRPTASGIRIRRFEVAVDGAKLHGREIGIAWHPAGLLQGQLDTLIARDLHLIIDPTTLLDRELASGEVGPDGGAAPLLAEGDLTGPLIEDYFARLPFNVVQVDELRVEIPGLEFEALGSLRLDRAQLALALTGVLPEEAEGMDLDLRIDRHAEVAARLTRAADAGEPFLEIRSKAPEEALRLEARFHLSGFVLRLVEAFSGLPHGDGDVQGEITLTHPWPIGSPPTPDGWLAEGVLRMDWVADDGLLRVIGLGGGISLADNQLNWVTGDRPEGRIAWALNSALISFSPREIKVGLLNQNHEATGAFRIQIEDGVSDAQAASSSSVLPFPFALTGSAQLSATTDAPDQIRLGGSLDSVLQVSGRELPVDMSFTAALLDETLQANASISSGPVKLLPVQLEYSLKNASFVLESAHTQIVSQPLIAALWPGWDRPYDMDRGEVRVTAKLQQAGAGPYSGALSASLSGAGGYFSESAVRGANGMLRLRIDEKGLVLEPSELSIALLDFGLPIRDISTGFGGNLNQLQFEESRGQVLEGRFRLKPFEYAVDAGRADLLVVLEDVSLAALLALEGDDLTGTGRLDGRIPIAVRENRLAVSGGELSARPPGGELRLDSAIASALTQPGLDLALGALTNFQYRALSAKVEYSESGDLQLGIRLEGRNPAVEKGRAIHYNLNVSENIPTLLQSLRLQDAFTERIQRRVLR